MKKLVAIACVVSWSGFWAFGYLALSAEPQNTTQIAIAAILAALGFLTGIFTYIRLSHQNPAKYTRVQQG
jgi:predicted RND superfamily exporter protein